MEAHAGCLMLVLGVRVGQRLPFGVVVVDLGDVIV